VVIAASQKSRAMQSKPTAQKTEGATALRRAGNASVLLAIVSLASSLLGLKLIVAGYTSLLLCSSFIAMWFALWLIGVLVAQRTLTTFDRGSIRNNTRTKAQVALMISFVNVAAVVAAGLVFWTAMPKGY
jgi:hypothetical protein